MGNLAGDLAGILRDYFGPPVVKKRLKKLSGEISEHFSWENFVAPKRNLLRGIFPDPHKKRLKHFSGKCRSIFRGK